MQALCNIQNFFKEQQQRKIHVRLWKQDQVIQNNKIWGETQLFEKQGVCNLRLKTLAPVIFEHLSAERHNLAHYSKYLPLKSWGLKLLDFDWMVPPGLVIHTQSFALGFVSFFLCCFFKHLWHITGEEFSVAEPG